MRSPTSTLGLTIIVAAIAVAVKKDATEADITAQKSPHETGAERMPPSSVGVVPSTRSIREMRAHPPKSATIPTGAKMAELTQQLDLSHDQQVTLHPALIRAGHLYDPTMPYLVLGEKTPRRLGSPLTRPDFEDALFATLDGEQQLDYVANATEKDLWWSAIISRLEAELDHETDPIDRLPSPPQPLPEAPTHIAPSSNRDRQLLPPTSH